MSTARDCTAPNTVSCRQSKNYDLQSVCSTCKNAEYIYRTFSVAVSVAVMLLKKGSVERFCETKIRTKLRDSPCESVYEFLHELCVLHIFVVCAGQVHVRHDLISRNFLRQFISRSLQVSRPKLRKFVRSFALHDVERKLVRIFVLQNLSRLVTHLFHTRRVNESVWLRIFRCRRNLFVCLLEKQLYSLVIK